MPVRIRNNGLEWVESRLISEFGIPHGIFTRHGGVSPDPWDSLNIGGTVGDTTENTIENKKRMFAVLGLDVHSAFEGWQVHSADYIRVEQPRKPEEDFQKADILVTHRPGLTLVMRFADCVPLLAWDPRQRVIAIAHAGWVGTTRNVAEKMVAALQHEYGTRSEDLVTFIGPSIGQEHYPVGEEVLKAVQGVLGDDADQVVARKNGQVYLDLWKTNEIELKKAGVQQIEIAAICTACAPQDWFSHRAYHGKTGRFGAIIQIPES